MEVLFAAIAAMFILSALHRDPAERRRALRRHAPQRRTRAFGSWDNPTLSLSQPRRSATRW